MEFLKAIQVTDRHLWMPLAQDVSAVQPSWQAYNNCLPVWEVDESSKSNVLLMSNE